MKNNHKDIATAFNHNAETYPNKSTEWLLQFTADQLEVDYMDVVDAVVIEVFPNKRDE